MIVLWMSRKELTKQLISEMSQGELWLDQGVEQYGKKTVQPITKAIYKGGNRFRLMLAAHLEQYTDNRWVTFAQAQEKAGRIKKGKKECSVKSGYLKKRKR